MLRLGAGAIAPSLTVIFNISLSSGDLPADWKYARVTPIYKGKGAIDDCGNYRPISVISHISKIMEKAVLFQLKQYLSTHDFISNSQSAFIKNHSTTTAVQRVISDILDGFNENDITTMCFIDLQKCFDTIDHSILLQKLQIYGFKGITYDWFKNYLHCRKQCVYSNGMKSSFLDMVMGIPQGSILGPALFLLFINDLPNCITKCYCNIFADDTTIYSHSSSFDEAEVNLQSDIDNLIKWFTTNKLHVNVSKSSCMSFTTRNNIRELNITINGNALKVENDVKYLGVHINDNISWNRHIANVCKRLGHGFQILRKLNNVIPVNDMFTIYKTLIQPHIDYCITIWGYAPKCHLQRIQRLQNKIFRLITNQFGWDTSPRDILNDLDVHNVTQRRDYFNGVNVYRCLNGFYPNYMSDMLHDSSDYNLYTTRNTSTGFLYVPKPRLEIYRQAFQYTGPNLYNDIPNDIKTSQTLSCFKSKLRNYTMHN